MSNESRTMLIVLLVCGLLMFGCIVLPVGLGAAFFFMASQRSEVAAAQQAIAAEQAARAQAARAQADAQTAQQALQSALRAPSTNSPAPSPVRVPEVTQLPSATQLPPIPLPPTITLPDDIVPSDIAAVVLADVEQRKSLYKGIKGMLANEEQLKKTPGVDPGTLALFESVKQQGDAAMKAMGLTEEHIKKILEEGDREGW